MLSNVLPHIELEATLVLVGPDPPALLAQIGQLTSIANFALEPRDSLAIHDTYFDTKDRALRARDWGLRVRHVGRKRWMTLKGSSSPTPWGAVTYTEIQREWSKEAFSEAIGHLAEIGIELAPMSWCLDLAEPVEAMERLGLEIVQDRETLPQVRAVFDKSREQEVPLAELVLDTVTYRVHDIEILHYEIEIEARQHEAGDAVRAIQQTLSDMFGPLLRLWPHSKLATGWAIERLITTGALDDVVRTWTVMPGDYDSIDAFLEELATPEPRDPEKS